MSLRLLAERDLGRIVEDSARGFGWAVTITDPAGKSEDMTGLSNDIALVIDPETGAQLAGRTASVALRISSLLSRGFAMPEAVEDTSGKPWTVAFSDINGGSHLFKISDSDPDRSIGLVVCALEAYSLILPEGEYLVDPGDFSYLVDPNDGAFLVPPA